MRISGTYIERLIYLFIPMSFLAAMLLWIFAVDTDVIIKGFVTLALVCWLADTLIILFYYKNPQKLVLEGEQIRYGSNNLAFSEIKSIEIITDRFYRFTFRMIKIELFSSKTVYSIAKPVFIIDLIKGRKSKTEDIIRSIPELKDKLLTE